MDQAAQLTGPDPGDPCPGRRSCRCRQTCPPHTSLEGTLMKLAVLGTGMVGTRDPETTLMGPLGTPHFNFQLVR